MARFMPSYAVMIALACVGGACSDEGIEPAPPADTCPPCPLGWNIEMNGSALQSSICNNDTFTWLVHTMVAEISKQKEEAVEKAMLLQDYIDRLEDTERMAIQFAYDVEDIQDENIEIRKENERLREELNAFKEKSQPQKAGEAKPRDCADVQQFGFRYSGLYTIYPQGFEEGLGVFCDLNTDHGGWLVIQRREDGSQDFAQDWQNYKHGFGNLAKEFYLGNDKIHKLTQQRRYTLRVDLTDFEGESGYADYGRFTIEDEEDFYRLKIGDYFGNAGDSLLHHNRAPFSTHDADHDRSRSGDCSNLFGKGGGWFVRCYDSNLNGQYGLNQDSKGVVWLQWQQDFTPLRHVEMKIRPLEFQNKSHFY